MIPIGLEHPWAFIALAAMPLAADPARRVLRGGAPPSLVQALIHTVRLAVVLAVLLSIGSVVA